MEWLSEEWFSELERCTRFEEMLVQIPLGAWAELGLQLVTSLLVSFGSKILIGTQAISD